MITRAYVIDNGRIRFEGTVAELEANEKLRKIPDGIISKYTGCRYMVP